MKPVMTYHEFRAAYGRYQIGFWRYLLHCLPGRRNWDELDAPRRWDVDWMRIAFALRVRVPNRYGFFAGEHSKGASWCWPWRWHRRYYDVRFPTASR